MNRAKCVVISLVVLFTASGAGQNGQPRLSIPLVLVHGGAGNIADDSLPVIFEGVKNAVRTGYAALQRSGSVLDAVEAAVNTLEANKNFNAGYGAVLTLDGTVEMDASLMDGSTLDAGAVSLAQDIMHPISLARRIMENTKHTYLAGAGAMRFAEEQGFEILPPGSLVTDAALNELAEYKRCQNNSELCMANAPETALTLAEIVERYDDAPSAQMDVQRVTPGTVGALAIDAYGNVAAATSTGGLTGKMPGRIGDSPILGAGTYADNAYGAVSCTGHGESIMRYNVASRILSYVRFEGYSAQAATMQVLQEMLAKFNQTAGVISLDALGQVGIYFTTKRMSWAYQRGDELHYGADANDDFVETIGGGFDFY